MTIQAIYNLYGLQCTMNPINLIGIVQSQIVNHFVINHFKSVSSEKSWSP